MEENGGKGPGKRLRVLNVDENENLALFRENTEVLRAGYVYLEPGKECGEHSTGKHEEMLIVLEGEGKVIAENEMHEVGKDSVVYIPPYTPHNLRASNGPLRYIYVVAPAFFDTERIDWIGVYNRLVAKRMQGMRADRTEDQWKDLAEYYDEWCRLTNYPGKILDRVLSFLDRDFRILEIGPGTGAFTIPVAEHVKEVVALEPSGAMINVLERKINEKGIDNIRIIKSGLEEAESEKIGKFDIVLAAYSLGVRDFRTAIEKMNSFSGKYCIIIDGDRTMNDGVRTAERILREKLGMERRPYLPYLFKADALRQMGIHANIEIVDSRADVPWGLYIRDRKNRYRARWRGGIEDELRTDLKDRGLLVKRDGKTYIISDGCHAMLWWKSQKE